MLHDTWVQWTVSPCYQDPLTNHLFNIQLSCRMGHRIDTLVRVIKHLDIYTCIISCIVFSDLVPDLYFHDTDTWDSCDMHYLDYMMFLDHHVILSCDLVFLWSCDYTTQQLLIQNISCSLYICHTMHARSPCTWSIVLIILIIVITFSSRY